MHTTRIIRIAAFLTVAFALEGACAWSAEPAAGKIVTATGQVSIQRGSAAPIGAKSGVAVRSGDRVITGADGHVVIAMSDQSQLELFSSSNFTIDQYGKDADAPKRVGLFSGLLRSVVKATGGAPANFQVHTPNAVAAVRGTEWYTGYSGNEERPGYLGCDRFTDISVLSGTVNVAAVQAPDQNMDVEPGHEATLPCDGPWVTGGRELPLPNH
ncbi:MAG TPA: FecR family protein [Candidatus Binataceae bacterium]|nr:FecR family protein [Candidatus Binataceae bacterium]